HLRRKLLESLCLAMRIPALNDDVLPLHVAELPEALKKCIETWKVFVSDIADPPNLPRLLRATSQRPRNHRATENGDELPPPHSTPSSTMRSKNIRSRIIAQAILLRRRRQLAEGSAKNCPG